MGGFFMSRALGHRVQRREQLAGADDRYGLVFANTECLIEETTLEGQHVFPVACPGYVDVRVSRICKNGFNGNYARLDVVQELRKMILIMLGIDLCKFVGVEFELEKVIDLMTFSLGNDH